MRDSSAELPSSNGNGAKRSPEVLEELVETLTHRVELMDQTLESLTDTVDTLVRGQEAIKDLLAEILGRLPERALKP